MSVVIHRADVVIVGAGIAGMTAALHAPHRAVTILSKSTRLEGGASKLAMGGVAVALDAEDSPSRHALDTLAVGGGLNDPEIVRLVTGEGPSRLKGLIALGARLDRDAGGALALGREAAHSRRRVVHAAGDATGAELVRCLTEATTAAPHVQVDEHRLALELVRSGERVVGVAAVDRDGRRHLYLAGAVVLAAGGVGQLWRHTTNPKGATGDGLAMAARAGARLAGLELVQFHPTALRGGDDPMPLLTEALRGEGATLIDERGHRFMAPLHPLAELAPRDVVARAIWAHAADGHEPRLDARGLGAALATRFPTVTRHCHERGLDPQRQPLPISPAAHYHMGGVVVDPHGRASLEGLWACGEVAHTGLHGANRLASNSLLEAVVFGARVGEALAREGVPRAGVVDHPISWPPSTPWLDEDGEAHEVIAELRALMWSKVGLARDEAGLSEAARRISALPRGGAGEAGHALLVAGLIAEAARLRTESRGAHARVDLPLADPRWRRPLFFRGVRPERRRAMDEAQVVVG